MIRYIKRLERKIYPLTHSMISLGSCTMKLNAATEMIPLSWEHWGTIHPFVPVNQAEGYQKLIKTLERFGYDYWFCSNFTSTKFWSSKVNMLV